VRTIVTTLALSLVLCAGAFASITPCPNGGTNGNLAYYITNFTDSTNACQIDDKIFYGFGAVLTNVTSSNVSITVDNTHLDPGLDFNPNMTVSSGTGTTDVFQDIRLTFIVQILPGGNLIHDDSLSIQGGASFGGTGTVSIGETACAGGTFTGLGGACTGTDYSLNVANPGPPYKPFDIVFTNPVTIVDVAKDVAVHSGSSGNAALSDFGQNFSEVPEPVSIMLFGSTILVSTFVYRRKRRQ